MSEIGLGSGAVLFLAGLLVVNAALSGHDQHKAAGIFVGGVFLALGVALLIVGALRVGRKGEK